MSSWHKDLTKAPPAALSASGDTGIGRAPAAGAPLDCKDETLAAMLLTHLWRYIDAGGLSMGRSFYAQMLEPARTLLDKYRPHADIADWPSVDDTRRVAERRAAELVREEANRDRERLGIPAYWEPPAAGAPPALVALVERQVELLGQCEAFIAEQFDADDDDSVALSNAILAIRKTLESSVLAWSPAPAPVAPDENDDDALFIAGAVTGESGGLPPRAPAPVAPPAETCAGCGGRGVVGGYAPVEYAEGITGSEAVDVPCPDCQSPAPPAVAGGDAPYCRECGSDLVIYVTAHADSESWYCKNCGQNFSWRRRQEGQ